MEKTDKFIIGLDVTSVYDAALIVERTIEFCDFYKVRLPLLKQGGNLLGRFLGVTKLMADVKLHDIPSSVAADVRDLLPLAPRFITVHGSGGPRMIEAARRAAEEGGAERPKIIAVTILTSLDRSELMEIGFAGWLYPNMVVERIARSAVNAGADGLVCSGRELATLRSTYGQSVILITPGIRLEGQGEADDQARTVTPTEAVRSGSDHLVVGRPVTGANNQRAVAASILREIHDATLQPLA